MFFDSSDFIIIGFCSGLVCLVLAVVSMISAIKRDLNAATVGLILSLTAAIFTCLSVGPSSRIEEYIKLIFQGFALFGAILYLVSKRKVVGEE